MIRLATLNDIDSIKEVAKNDVDTLGFIGNMIRGAVENKEMLFDSTSHGFCFFHLRRDGVTVIYEICVPKEFRGRGIAKSMINMLPPPVELKCPVDNESNDFYKHIGFALVRVDPGKKRQLNVWRLE